MKLRHLFIRRSGGARDHPQRRALPQRLLTRPVLSHKKCRCRLYHTRRVVCNQNLIYAESDASDFRIQGDSRINTSKGGNLSPLEWFTMNEPCRCHGICVLLSGKLPMKSISKYGHKFAYLSHRMYLSISIAKSTPPHNCQLSEEVYYQAGVYKRTEYRIHDAKWPYNVLRPL